MNLLFVVNPVSGGEEKASFLQRAKDYCYKYGISCATYETTGENDEDKLLQCLTEHQPDKIVVVGGDGTVLLTARTLLQTKRTIPFGMIPMGSANGMARELNVSTDPFEAFRDLAVSHVALPIDMICMNDQHYLMHLGDAGLNASIVENYEKEEGRGWLAYAKHFVHAIRNTPLFEAHIQMEDGAHDYQTSAVVMANTRMYGTGATINPKGNPHDGKFEIVVVKKNELSSIINLGLTTISDKAIENFNEYFDIYTTDRATITFKSPKVVQLDGEVTGSFEQLQLSIVPSAVYCLSTMRYRLADKYGKSISELG